MTGKASANLMGTFTSGPLARAEASNVAESQGASLHAQRLDSLHHGRQVAHQFHDAAADDHCSEEKSDEGGVLRPQDQRLHVRCRRPCFQPLMSAAKTTRVAQAPGAQGAPPLSTTPVTRVEMEESATGGNL